MKIDRLIGIVTILLQTEKSTVPALAQRFEVSRRTIERDIDALCRAGVPLVTVQGYGGGVFIEPRYKLDKTLLRFRYEGAPDPTPPAVGPVNDGLSGFIIHRAQIICRGAAFFQL